MKKAINAWSIPNNIAFDEMFSQIKSAGFVGIELNIDKPDSSAHSLTIDTSKQQLQKIKESSDKYGIVIHSISTSQYCNLLGSNRKGDNETAKNLLRKQLEFADFFNSTSVLAVPGGVSDYVSLKQAYENSYNALSSMKSELAGCKIDIGLENVWNTFFMSPFDMRNFIDDLNIDCIGAYFDIGNVASFSEPCHWIEILGNKIKKVHLKDYARCDRIFSGNWVNLLEGTFSWENTIKALRATGYDDYLTAELEINKVCPSYLYDITSKALDIIIKM